MGGVSKKSAFIISFLTPVLTSEPVTGGLFSVCTCAGNLPGENACTSCDTRFTSNFFYSVDNPLFVVNVCCLLAFRQGML
jgi:hypothetical protein